MIRVALKGLAARPVRTALTTLAIVARRRHGERPPSRSPTRCAAPPTTSRPSAYDGTDAVVSGPSRVRHDRRLRDTAAADDRRPRARPASARCRGVAVAERRHHRPRRRSSARTASPSATGRTSAIGLDPAAARAGKVSPVPPRRAAAGRPGRARSSSSRVRPASSTYAVGDGSASPPPVAVRPFTRHGRRDASAPSSRSARPPWRVFDLRAAQDAVRQAGHVRRDPRGRPTRASRARRCATTVAAALPHAKVQTAATQDRFTLDGLKQFISIIRGVLIVLRLAWRCSSARSRSSTRSRSPSPSARASSACCAWSARRAGRCCAR